MLDDQSLVPEGITLFGGALGLLSSFFKWIDAELLTWLDIHAAGLGVLLSAIAVFGGLYLRWRQPRENQTNR